MTRSQQLMGLAEERVREVRDTRELAGIRETYRQLCKDFPVMVRVCGLCQTLAFYLDKAAKEPAHERVLEDVAAVLRRAGHSDVLTPRDAVNAVRGLPTMKYMLATRWTVDAWLFFKRFAVALIPETD